jgi:hypothetical protein
MKPRIGEVYEVPGPGSGSYRIVSIGPSPFTPGRYKRIGAKWLGLHDSHEAAAISYFDTKMMRRWGMKLRSSQRQKTNHHARSR